MNDRPNYAIKCGAERCSHHCDCGGYCSLGSITVSADSVTGTVCSSFSDSKPERDIFGD